MYTTWHFTSEIWKKKILQAENVLPVKFHCLFVTTSIMFKTQKAGIPQIFTKPHNPPDLNSLKVIELQTIKLLISLSKTKHWKPA